MEKQRYFRVDGYYTGNNKPICKEVVQVGGAHINNPNELEQTVANFVSMEEFEKAIQGNRQRIKILQYSEMDVLDIQLFKDKCERGGKAGKGSIRHVTEMLVKASTSNLLDATLCSINANLDREFNLFGMKNSEDTPFQHHPTPIGVVQAIQKEHGAVFSITSTIDRTDIVIVVRNGEQPVEVRGSGLESTLLEALDMYGKWYVSTKEKYK